MALRRNRAAKYAIIEIPGCLSRFGSAVLKKRSSASTTRCSRYVARDDMYSTNRWGAFCRCEILGAHRFILCKSSLATYLLTKQAPGTVVLALLRFFRTALPNLLRHPGISMTKMATSLCVLRCLISPQRHRQGLNRCN